MALASSMLRSPMALAGATSRPALSLKAGLPRPFLPGGLPQRTCIKRRSVLVSAEVKSVDFDGLLAGLAEKFEKSTNKPVVVGYVVAALAAFFTTEWLLHLPGLDILLGFPVQLLGVLLLPYLGVKYLVNGDDVLADTGKAVETITAKLPGLKD